MSGIKYGQEETNHRKSDTGMSGKVLLHITAPLKQMISYGTFRNAEGCGNLVVTFSFQPAHSENKLPLGWELLNCPKRKAVIVIIMYGILGFFMGRRAIAQDFSLDGTFEAGPL